MGEDSSHDLRYSSTTGLTQAGEPDALYLHIGAATSLIGSWLAGRLLIPHVPQFPHFWVTLGHSTYLIGVWRKHVAPALCLGPGSGFKDLKMLDSPQLSAPLGSRIARRRLSHPKSPCLSGWRAPWMWHCDIAEAVLAVLLETPLKEQLFSALPARREKRRQRSKRKDKSPRRDAGLKKNAIELSPWKIYIIVEVNTQ